MHNLRTFVLWLAGVFVWYWLASGMYWRADSTIRKHGKNAAALASGVVAFLLTVCSLAVVVALVLVVRWTWETL